MTVGAVSPPWISSVTASAFVDSASPGRKDVDSFFSASLNFSGSPRPTVAKIAANQTAQTTHLARRPDGMAKTRLIARHYGPRRARDRDWRAGATRRRRGARRARPAR